MEDVTAPVEDEWKLWVRSFSIRLDSLERRIEETASMTCEIRADTAELVQAYKTAQGAGKVVKVISKPVVWLTTTGASITALYAAFQGWRGR